MRHGKKVMHLGRKTAHRKSMLTNMACSLIAHKRINTTVTKAKALKQFIEPIVTKSKTDSTHNRRLAFSSLRDKNAVTELFRTVAVKIADRPGGYTRIIKLGNRMGDNAEMALIEFVDFNEVYTKEGKPKKKSRRRGSKSKSEAPAVTTEETQEVAATEKAETPVQQEKEAAPKAKKAAAKKEDKAKDESDDA